MQSRIRALFLSVHMIIIVYDIVPLFASIMLVKQAKAAFDAIFCTPGNPEVIGCYGPG